MLPPPYIKRFILLPLLLMLGGCASFGDFLNPGARSILQGGVSITAAVQNPVGPNEMVAIESAYRAALVAAENYRRYCYSAALASLPALCAKRRAVVTALQGANRKVRAAMVALRAFVRNNDTVSAWSAIGAARQAILDFQAVAAANGVT